MENIWKTYRKHMENIWKIHGIHTFPMLFLRFPLGLALAFLWLHCGKKSLQVTLFDVFNQQGTRLGALAPSLKRLHISHASSLFWLWPGTPGVYKWGIATQVGNYENLNKMVTVRKWGVASRVPRISSLFR